MILLLAWGGWVVWGFVEKLPTVRDYEVYSAVLAQYAFADPEPPGEDGSRPEYERRWLHIDPHLRSFQENKTSSTIAPVLHPDESIPLQGLHPSTWRNHLARPPSGTLDPSRLEIPGHLKSVDGLRADATVTFSRVGYGRGGDQALLFLTWGKGTGGAGEWILLHRRAGRWMITATLRVWIA